MIFIGLCSLFVWLSVAIQALATPIRHLAFHHRHHRDHRSISNSELQRRAQRPLLAHPAKPSPLEVKQADILVGLTFEVEDSEHGVRLREVTFPMRKRIRPDEFPGLPRLPRIARLDYAYCSGPPEISVKPYESIEAVVCYVYLAMEEERGRSGPAYEFLAFKRQDEVVDFQDPGGKAYLAGRAVDSLECV